MNTIFLHGVVGIDILAKDFSKTIDNMTGDVELDINSGGGYITEGITITNKIRTYDNGKITARVSYAASMATQIALAADEVQVYDNSVFMIHNAQGVAVGDYRVMEKQRNVLKSLSNLLSQAYINKTGKSKETVLKMMNNETFLYGSEIVQEKFADKLVSGGEAGVHRDDAMAFAQLRFAEAMQALKNEEFQEDRLAALGEKHMNMSQLKLEHPELYSAVFELGIAHERERVCAHLTLGEASGDLSISIASIQAGEGVTPTISARHMAANMRRREVMDRGSEKVPRIVAAEDTTDDESMARAVAKLLGGANA